jgi:hypothetical protein
MSAWQYCWVSANPDKVFTRMQEWGLEGWELVSVVAETTVVRRYSPDVQEQEVKAVRAWFKRAAS